MPGTVEIVAGFAHVLRASGIPVDVARTRMAVEALAVVGLDRRDTVRAALRSCLCSSPLHCESFDLAFDLYFAGVVAPLARRPGEPVQRPVFAAVPVTGPAGGHREQPPVSSQASEAEVLRQRDLARLTEDERSQVRRLIAALRPIGSVRRSRRYRPARRGRWDGSASVRASFRQAGELALRRHRFAVKRRRLVLLLDISGSMSGYADAYLRLAHAALLARTGTEVFTMGTRLTRVTRQLAARDADAALRAATSTAPDIAGGTRLGTLLGEFLQVWGRRGMARGADVIICSDGWERGDPGRLADAVIELRRVAHRVIWVNPHEGSPGFEPLTAGLRAVLPLVDAMHSGYTLAALERLCEVIGRSAPDGSVPRSWTARIGS